MCYTDLYFETKPHDVLTDLGTKQHDVEPRPGGVNKKYKSHKTHKKTQENIRKHKSYNITYFTPKANISKTSSDERWSKRSRKKGHGKRQYQTCHIISYIHIRV